MIIGQIESYDSEKKIGIVKDQEEFFEFDEASWVSSVPPDSGDEVTFELNDGVVINMRLVAETLKPVQAVKSRWIATLLAVLFGWLGAHRFYLGHYKIGFIQVAGLLLIQGYIAVWAIFDALLLFSGHINKDGKGRPLK
jgi:TM2 domain-containing membrane protein YozV